MKLNKLLILTLFFLLKIADASAQFSLSIRDNQVTKELSSLWNINLAYTGAKNEEELQLKLSLMNDNDKAIYEVLSPILLLSNKEVRQLNSGFTISQVITNELNSGFLLDGKYEVVYREYKSNKTLKRRQFTVNGYNVTFNNQADSAKMNVKKWINITGSARLTTMFNHPVGLNSEQKELATRFEFNPTLIFFGQLPISASVLLTTEQNAGIQPMNQFSLNFDYNYFRTLLEQKAMAKIEEMKAKNGLGDMKDLREKFIKEKNKGYEKLKEKMASPEVKEQLAKAEEYNSLQKQSGNLESSIDRSKLDELRTKYGVTTMEQLDAKKDSMPAKDYNEYKFQMTTSDAQADAQKELKKLEGAKENAKKLEKDKEKLDKIENTDYMQMMRDPKYNKEILNKLGLSSAATKIMGGIKTFSIGTSYPLYSELTMNGVRSSGINLELNPGILYLAFTKGNIRSQRYDTSLGIYDFQQNVLAGRLGLGKKNATHFILTYIKTEEAGAAFTSPIDSVQHTPGNNLVTGADFQLSLFKKRFVTQAEVNGALTTADINAPGIPNVGSDATKITDILGKLNYKANLTTRSDYAYSVRTEMNLFGSNTQLSGNYSYIGPGYTSFTSPYLINDLLKYEAKLSQSFWMKRISLGGFYKYMTDDLFNSKSYKTTISGYGAEFNISLPKLPSLWAKYLPVNQVSDMTIGAQQGKLASNMTMAGSSYNYNFSGFSCNTQLVLTQYNMNDQYSGTNLLMSTYMLTHNMALSNGMNCGFNGFYNAVNDAHANNQLGCALTESSMIKKKLMTAFELHYLSEGSIASKTGISANLGIKVIKNINTQLKVTYNSINSSILGSRTETYGFLVINVGW